MKKIKMIFAGCFLLLLVTGASYAQPTHNDNYYKGQATALLHDCLSDAHQAGLVVHSAVIHDETSCLNSVTVEFWGTPHCPGNMICIAVVYPIGSVTFDCHGNPVVIACGAPGPIEL